MSPALIPLFLFCLLRTSWRFSEWASICERYQFLLRISAREKQKIDEKARTFFMLASQWNLHPNPEWRQRWINEAKKWQDKIPEAKAFLKRVCKWLMFTFC
jgi:hypothetical protein